jgi:GR25 family glycosyltransferase involved in LPS biosynthesis
MSGNAIICLNGGLGNQLFQIATTYSYAKEHNKNPIYITNSKLDYSKTYLSNIPLGNKMIKYPRYTEVSYSYSKIPHYKKDIWMNGYFQSAKYFQGYEGDIKTLFKTPEKLTEQITVAVHIKSIDRATFYNYSYNQNPEYYHIAKIAMINKLGKDIKFIYFCNDIEWVRKNLEPRENDSIVKLNKDYDDFLLIQSCHHFITSNSVFSWWAAWLSKSKGKIVIAPYKWFGPRGQKNWQDIYPNDWIVLSDYTDSYFEGITDDLRINLGHKYWRDDIIIQNDMQFYRHLNNNEKGTLFVANDIKLLWDNHGCETTEDFICIKGDIDKIKNINSLNIQNRITNITNDKSYDLYVINLDHRKDRLDEFLDSAKNQPFNIYRFSAVKHTKGFFGCGLSHLSLIKYAKENNLPYIIVAEDDTVFKTQALPIMEKLINNLDKWTIFNGAPIFWDKRDDIHSIKVSDSFSDELLNINWGQSASFIIYNASVYDTMLSYNFKDQIDQFISRNFTQTILRNEMFSIQTGSYSDIRNVDQRNEFEEFFREQYRVINTLLQVKRKSIGIYGIFLGNYQVLYKDFISHIEANFYPNIKKYYYIVTDNKELPLYNDRTFIYNTEMIGWPYSTLYRFIYFLQFKREDINLSEAIFFINANGRIIQKIFSPIVNEPLFFTHHCAFIDKPYDILTYEKNDKSNACIPYEQGFNYEYFTGAFHGGETSEFIKMCEVLSERIFIDERNGYIAVWHDESHINRYCYELKKAGVNFGKFDPSYHVGENNIHNHKDIKIRFVGKHKYVPPGPNIKNFLNETKNIYGKIIPNKFNKIMY